MLERKSIVEKSFKKFDDVKKLEEILDIAKDALAKVQKMGVLTANSIIPDVVIADNDSKIPNLHPKAPIYHEYNRLFQHLRKVI